MLKYQQTRELNCIQKNLQLEYNTTRRENANIAARNHSSPLYVKISHKFAVRVIDFQVNTGEGETLFNIASRNCTQITYEFA